MEREEVTSVAVKLGLYAGHFTTRDWNYTREIPIEHIRYEGDWSGYNHPLRRVGRWLRPYFTIRAKDWLRAEGRKLAWRHPIIHARVALATEAHLPDGILDGGNIITHWEETGEYLQFVQPSVGLLIADMLREDPTGRHSQLIAAEMQRIQDAYAERLKEKRKND